MIVSFIDSDLHILWPIFEQYGLRIINVIEVDEKSGEMFEDYGEQVGTLYILEGDFRSNAVEKSILTDRFSDFNYVDYNIISTITSYLPNPLEKYMNIFMMTIENVVGPRRFGGDPEDGLGMSRGQTRLFIRR